MQKFRKQKYNLNVEVLLLVKLHVYKYVIILSNICRKKRNTTCKRNINIDTVRKNYWRYYVICHLDCLNF